MSIQEKIVEVMADYVSPMLRTHGGDAQFVSFDEKSGELAVRLIGACGTCPYALETLRMTVESTITERIPEVKSVIKV
jgi:Fe-S cluster biogenesis protein NfuA